MRIDPSGHSDYRDRMNRLRRAYGEKIWKQYRKAYHRNGYGALPTFSNADTDSVCDTLSCISGGGSFSGGSSLTSGPPIPFSGFACEGSNQSIICLPNQTSQPTLPIYPMLPLTDSNTVDFAGLEWKVIFVKYALAGVDLLSDAEDLVNSGRPLYKQVKYAFGTGPVESILDGLLYGFDDRWAVTMSNEVRVSRMAVVGAESLAIDGVATLAGYGGNLLLGKAGDIAFQYLTSKILTRDVKPHVTSWLFDRWDLGLPNEWRK